MRPCVIFDLDGTLADTSGDLIAAANRCFHEMGQDVRLDPARDAGIALRGGRAMLTAGLTRAGAMSDETVNAWYQRLLDVYGAEIDTHTRLYPGALDAVERLRSAGHAVGICTNKPEGLAETLMTRLGCRDMFGALIGADTLPTRKPDPAPYWAAVDGCGGTREASLIVGDTVTDLKTARAVGRPCILVEFGPAQADLDALAPDGRIASFAELDDEVARLLSI